MRTPIEIQWGLAAAVATGWVWGSFVNQLVDRSALRKKKRGARGAAEHWAAPDWPTLLRPARSVCLACRHPIAWYDNLPVFSYLALRGRCRHCAARITPRTLAMEVFMPAGFAGLFLLGAGGYAPLNPLPWGYLLLSWVAAAAAIICEGRTMAAWFWVGGGTGALGLAAQSLF